MVVDYTINFSTPIEHVHMEEVNLSLVNLTTMLPQDYSKVVTALSHGCYNLTITLSIDKLYMVALSLAWQNVNIPTLKLI